MSLVLNINTYLINEGIQKDSKEKFREYQNERGKDIAKRVLGEDMVP